MKPGTSLSRGFGQMRSDATPFFVGQIRGVNGALHGAQRRPPSPWPSTFQTVSRNCLINETGPEMGCQEQLRGGSRTPNIAVLNRRDAGPGCFYAFIRQFLEEEFCEL